MVGRAVEEVEGVLDGEAANKTTQTCLANLAVVVKQAKLCAPSFLLLTPSLLFLPPPQLRRLPPQRASLFCLPPLLLSTAFVPTRSRRSSVVSEPCHWCRRGGRVVRITTGGRPAARRGRGGGR